VPKVTPANGQVVEEVTRTRVLDAAAQEAEKSSPDPFEYMEQTPRDKWDQGEHIIYLYRLEPPVYRNVPGPTYVTKYGVPVTLDQIQQEYGGGLWRLLVKRGRERVADRQYAVSGAPRDLSRNGQDGPAATQGGAPSDGTVLSQAMNLAANPTAQQATTAILTSAAAASIEMVKANAPKQLSMQEIIVLAKELSPKTASFLESPLGIALAGKLIDRLFADPTEQFVKLMDVVSRMNGGSSASDWKAALVQAVPQIAEAGRGMLQELRLGAEAQAGVNAARTLNAAPASAPNPGAGAPVGVPAPQSNVVQMPSQPAGAPSMERITAFNTKLIELLSDPNMTGDKAGEILDAQFPEIVDEVSRMTADQIISIGFQRQPMLQPHAQNPRLREFLTQFLQWANESDAPAPAPQPSA
jgi:hypothetical protein